MDGGAENRWFTKVLMGSRVRRQDVMAVWLCCVVNYRLGQEFIVYPGMNMEGTSKLRYHSSRRGRSNDLLIPLGIERKRFSCFIIFPSARIRLVQSAVKYPDCTANLCQ